ncbi:PKD domain-containing protein [Flavobacteriales bacterium]|nr:PKD domain-containing protein [Flavobacteriales bacterium]
MKKISTTLLVNLFVFFTLSNLYSQNQVIEKCGFDHLRSMLLQDSNYLRKEIEAEQKIAQYISQSQLRSSSSVYSIPVVVHVLHLGETVGVGTNISDAQIQSAITNLNDVYRGLTAGSPVDFGIEFALAQQDPNCVAHSGINRINASSVPDYLSGGVDYYGDGGEADQDVLKNLSRWPETEYFNIWIVSEIEDNNGGFGIQGYANFFNGSAMEGSVMMASVFGFDPTNAQPSFNLNAPRDNSTVVHEFGHYLHLHHTFKGDGDADDDGIGDACPGDVTIGVDSDGCADTEVHKRYTSDCKSGQLNDCTGAIFGDNTAKNFMSYAYCIDRLTNDQKIRSRAMLATSGISLIYSKGDEAPVNYSTVIANANCSPQTSPTGLSGAYTGIKNFTIDGIFTNTSSWSDVDGGYVDNTLNCQKVINVFEDSTYNFEVSTLFSANNVKGYIDYNNDGDFLDANEEIFDINTADNTFGNYTSSSAVNITIPNSNGTSIISGNKLRLRLNSDIGTVANACEAPQHGQVEDYTIIINELVLNLTADFSSIDSTFCQGTSVTFTDLSTGTPTSWSWDFGDGTTSILQNPTHIYASAGTYDVSLAVNTSNGSDSETKTGFITVNINPNINAGIDQTICDGNNATLNATSSQNYVAGVTAAGASDYIFSGAFSGNDPAINISLGDTLTFNVNSPGHPFLIKTTNTTGTANAVTVTNNGTSVGTIIWSPTSDGTYYYICEYHAGMVGTITVGASNVNYTWNNNITNGTGFTPTSTNTYTVTGTDGNGCFSTDNVIVNLIPNSTGTDVISSCNSITWIDGITYTTSNNTSTYTLTNSAGCDSVVTLNLTINQALSGLDTQTACNSYTWIDGNTYTINNNTATYTLQTGNGCDSLVLLDLTINNSSTSLVNESSCNSYSWNGQTLLASGIYVDTNVNAAGCPQYDSLDLTITTTPNISNEVACDSFAWNGNSYSTSGTYTSSSTCVDTLKLVINNSSSSTSSLSSCGDITWNGSTYTTTGIYNFITISSVGCDSTATLNLTIDSAVFNQVNVAACDSFVWNANNYTSSGNYKDTLQNVNGCDSVVTLNLTVNTSTTNTLNEVACDSYSWNGVSYTIGGTYVDSLQTLNGCDSIVTLNIIINNSHLSVDSISACNSYLWNGNTYSLSGTYYDSSQTLTGCDSILILNLVIDSADIVQVNVNACDSYSWNNNIYSTNGIHNDTLQNSNGCDSIVTLNLTINNSFSSVDTISSCDNYSWNGTILSTSGTYLDTLQTISGCDSIVSLELTILESYIIEDSVSACGSYLWNGVLIDSSGIYTDTLQSITGCDSINILYLDVNDNTSAPLTLELLLDDYCLETFWTVKDSQDSIWYTEGPYDCNPSGGGNQANTTIIKDIYLEDNACYTFELNDVYGDGLSASFWNGADGNWTLQDLNSNIVSQGQGDFGFITANSFYVSQSTPSFINEENSSKLEVLVYPNPFSKTTTVRIINGKRPYLGELFDTRGRVVKSLSFNEDEFVLDGINASSGIYWLKIKNQSNLKPLKLVIE